MSAPVVRVPEELAPHLAAGHPWIYRDHLPRGFDAPDGWVEVVAGRLRAHALHEAGAALALRVYSLGPRPDPAWLRARVADAWALREPLRAAGVTAFRWIHGEGDGLPGIVVDFYEGFVVIALYARSVGLLLAPLIDALRDVARPRGILLRRERSEAAEGPAPRVAVERLHGAAPPDDLTVAEYDVRLRVAPGAGQKTGLFLDHRENRRWLAPHTRGRTLLNLFSFTGGFSLHAARAEAASVTDVDSAPGAIAASAENFALNGFDAARHRGVTADAFAFLEGAAAARERWDVVVCDPPSFAHKKTQLRRALVAYKRLNAAALAVVSPGGLFASASCTAQVAPHAFRQMLAEAARAAGVRLQLVHDAGQPLDHPIGVGHPEGRYLKFMVGRVLPRG